MVWLLPRAMPHGGFKLRPLFCLWNAALGAYAATILDTQACSDTDGTLVFTGGLKSGTSGDGQGSPLCSIAGVVSCLPFVLAGLRTRGLREMVCR
eukprot:gene3176-17456_t